MDKLILYVPFLLFLGRKTTSVSKAMDAFYDLTRGFTWMYTDIFQLIDSASLGHGVIHCGGEVFEECSSAFLLIFVVSFSGTLGLPLLMFPLASGAKEVKQELKPGTIVRIFLHSLKVIPVSIDLQKRLKFSYCSVVCQSNVGGFNPSVGAPGLRSLRASVRVARGSGADMTAEIRRYQYAYGALIQLIMGQMVPTNSGISTGA